MVRNRGHWFRLVFFHWPGPSMSIYFIKRTPMKRRLCQHHYTTISLLFLVPAPTGLFPARAFHAWIRADSVEPSCALIFFAESKRVRAGCLLLVFADAKSQTQNEASRQFCMYGSFFNPPTVELQHVDTFRWEGHAKTRA